VFDIVPVNEMLLGKGKSYINEDTITTNGVIDNAMKPSIVNCIFRMSFM